MNFNMNTLKLFSKIQKLGRFQEISAISARRSLATAAESHMENYKEPGSKTTYEKTINQVTLLGRVGNDPMKRGTDEHPVIVFSVATHNNYKYESGEFLEKTDWHRVVVFKPSLRDLVFNYLKKGQRIHISGKISYGSISDGGSLKPTTSIIADDIIFFYHGDT